MSKYSENMPPDISGAIGWMLPHIKPHSDFLDFGCSTGYFGAYIKEHKQCTVFGHEISDDRKEAKKVLDGIYSFDLDGAWPSEIYERHYDYLFFGDVLEHLKDPAATLKQASKLLKPNGKIFVSIPNIAHISIRLELLQGSFRYEPMGILDNTHLQYFTLETFTATARNAGYDAELIDYTANDIPQEIIEERLAVLGLDANQNFWNMTKTIESRAYQYKFVLVPTSVTRVRPSADMKPAIEKPLQFRDNIISDYRSQLKSLDDHSKAQAKLIDHFKQLAERLDREKKELANELDRVDKPLSYKLLHGYRARIVKFRLKGKR